jgi:2-polyprenyl-3-methyl-5-hydroxy-6-metoxy-1,4-benzoquinol methylase
MLNRRKKMTNIDGQQMVLETRFKFGENWANFLSNLGELQIQEAERSLEEMLKVKSLAGQTFLDIGNGSGVFSLAAMRLKADRVHSFDYDQQSVACAQELKRRYFPDNGQWVIEQGNALDEAYIRSLGDFDIVYSWGVLHHTGNMWRALDLARIPVKKGGKLFISIYNDQGRISSWWKTIKRAYNLLPSGLRFLILYPVLVKFWAGKTVGDILRGRPFHTWRSYATRRGMSAWYDVVDWAGGYPFEVASPAEICNFYIAKGFELRQLKTMGGGSGCNEYVFMRTS